MIENFEKLMADVKHYPRRKIAVAAAEDSEVIEVAYEAIKEQIADLILIGDARKIKDIIAGYAKDIDCEIVNEPDHNGAVQAAVDMVKSGQADAVMKGLLHTGTFLRIILDKDKGLNTGKLMSQVSVYDKEYGKGLQLLTDCAMAIEPTLNEKKQIIENSIELAHKLGYDRPKVALLSAVEMVNPAIADTLDAAVLSKMADRGQIKGAVVDGPFAFDNAVSIEAAKHKGITGEVAGNADILVVPNLQVGNVLHKSLTYIAHKDVGGAVVGCAAPLIMTSRTDSVQSKVMSIALACYTA